MQHVHALLRCREHRRFRQGQGRQFIAQLVLPRLPLHDARLALLQLLGEQGQLTLHAMLGVLLVLPRLIAGINGQLVLRLRFVQAFQLQLPFFVRQLLFFQLYLQAGNAFLQLRALAADVLQLLAGLLFVALIALAALLGVLDLLFQTGRLFAQGGALFG